MRGPVPADIPHDAIQKSHEADARKKTKGEDQPLPRRAEGVDGFRLGHRRGKRFQVGKSRYLRANSGPPPKTKTPTTSLIEPHAGGGQVPRRLHHLCQGSVQVPGVHPRRRHPPGDQANDSSRPQFEEDGQSVVAVNGPGTQCVHPAGFALPRSLPRASDAVFVEELPQPHGLFVGERAEGGRLEALVKFREDDRFDVLKLLNVSALTLG